MLQHNVLEPVWGLSEKNMCDWLTALDSSAFNHPPGISVEGNWAYISTVLIKPIRGSHKGESFTYTMSLRANAAQSIKSYIIHLHRHQQKGRLEDCDTGKNNETQ